MPVEDKAQSALEKVFVLLRAHTGNDFSLYKRSTIYRRIERRMGLHQIDSIAELRPLPAGEPAGDRAAVQGAADRRHQLLPRSARPGSTSGSDVHAGAARGRVAAGGVLRAWVPGCSTGRGGLFAGDGLQGGDRAVQAGEEPRACRSSPPTSTRTRSTRRAQGLYPDNIAADVSPERLRRFFVQEDRGYRVAQGDPRDGGVRAAERHHGSAVHASSTSCRCRNLLIYLSPELQKKLIPLFHYSLNPGGVLFLGSAETIGSLTDLFAPLDGKTRLYRRRDQSVTAGAGRVSRRPSARRPRRRRGPAARRGAEAAPPNLQALADRCSLQRFSPVGRALQRQGRHPLHQRPDRQVPGAGRRQGEPEHLRHGARGPALRAVRRVREGAPARTRRSTCAASRSGRNGGTQLVDLTVTGSPSPRSCAGTVIVVITDVAGAAEPQARRSRRKPPRRRARAGGAGAGAAAGARGGRRPRARRCRPRRRSSSRPTRSCSPPTRSCSAPTRS